MTSDGGRVIAFGTRHSRAFGPVLNWNLVVKAAVESASDLVYIWKPDLHAVDELVSSLQLYKKGPSPTFIPETRDDTRDEERSVRIRCPLCQWQPTPSTVWACESYGTPEPYFGGCGTVWNTFATHGTCPGCAHRWQWTSCPRCEQWSLHDDWYEEEL